jgi:hypothetical protein
MVSLLAGLTTIGCVDVEGDYDDYKERDKKTTDPVGAGCDPDAGAAPCDPVTAGTLDGQWLFALSASLSPQSPLLFFANITSTDNAGQIDWEWTVTPLDARTRTPLTGADVTFPNSTIPADGNWTVQLGTISVPGEANPITVGNVIEAQNVALTGSVCGGRDFLCGTVTGDVTKPLPLPLEGSTWTLQRLTAPDTLPGQIIVDCKCTLAGPPPT